MRIKQQLIRDSLINKKVTQEEKKEVYNLFFLRDIGIHEIFIDVNHWKAYVDSMTILIEDEKEKRASH